MLRLAEVVRRHGPRYVERYGASMLPSHVRAIHDIVRCRTAALGGHLAECDACGREHVLYHSCRNRACPQCGQDAAERWVEGQRELLLPVPYFHVVFTLPAELRRVVRSHQKELLPVLFRAAFDSLATLCRDARFLGAQIGALSVLHTWTRTLEWHPHIHMLVPGGGLGPDGRTWVGVPRRKKLFLVPVKALSKLFRGRFLHLARRALPSVPLPYVPYEKRWVVFAKPTVQGSEQVLDYLGRYVQRTALSDHALVRADEQSVTFRYRDSVGHQQKEMTLGAEEFLRRFLQHVPPKGFHRVRAFGLLHPEHRVTLLRLKLLLAPRQSLCPLRVGSELARGERSCPSCGSLELRLVRRLSAAECLERESQLAAPSVDRPGLARAPPPSTYPLAMRRSS
jgi:hypothetical protein